MGMSILETGQMLETGQKPKKNLKAEAAKEVRKTIQEQRQIM